jgi:hypothetical protein
MPAQGGPLGLSFGERAELRYHLYGLPPKKALSLLLTLELRLSWLYVLVAHAKHNVEPALTRAP